MSLNPEWARRIADWNKLLREHFVQPLGALPLSGFTTREHLSPREAARGKFRPMPTGATWGGKWEYGWFKTRVVLPRAVVGRRIVARLNPGGEGLVFINGKVAGSRGCGRDEVTLTTSGRTGQVFELLVEAYAGHGPTPSSIGPVWPGRSPIPEPPAAQQIVKPSDFGIWEEDVYQLWLDVQTLWELRENLDQNSLRVSEIDAALRDFSTIIDFELPGERFLDTVRAARRRLAPLLRCRNGSTAPVMFAFGHGHLDVAWLWPLAETERKVARTLGNQLSLAREYPGYRFMHSQAHLFWMLKQRHPEFYRRVKNAVADGSVIPEGGMWVEADTNITGGESLIRQFLHGKRFFEHEFGVKCQMLWLPDVFGYSAALPQVMAGCGIRYFTTQKIFWNYNGGEPFPHNTFWWEGIDGSRVLVHLHNDYNSQTSPAHVIRRWNERVQKNGISTRLMPFGWGDGGGGPTRDHVEFAIRQRNLEGSPRVKLSGPLEFFRDLERRGDTSIRYVGELYFQAHRGTYTSQAKTKRGNRKSEVALREAEFWSAAATGFRYPVKKMEAAWRQLLLNQFHDILPGSSIARVHEEAEAGFARVMETADRVRSAAQSGLVRGVKSLTVFNSLSWPRRELVALPPGVRGAEDANGAALPTQKIGSRRHAEVEVPSCGWTTVRPAGAVRARFPQDSAAQGTERSLENGLIRVRFNDRGEIVSLYDKEVRREICSGKANEMRMYKDTPAKYDAWDLENSYRDMPVELAGAARIEVVSRGPLCAQVKVTRKLNESDMVQTITLRRGSRRLDFDTVIAWRENHKILKVCFPADIHTDEAVHEIQFGHVRRPNHYSRTYDADRFEVCNHKWTALVEEGRGFAVLNDCKYGVNVLGNSINLTLLRASKAPDFYADVGLQTFKYAVYAWNGPLFESRLVREAYELNVPVTTRGGGASTTSLFDVSEANVVIEAVKPAEADPRDIIVRLYECMGTGTRCTLRTTLPVKFAEETDMLEQRVKTLSIRSGTIGLQLRPFEIKTLRLRR